MINDKLIKFFKDHGFRYNDDFDAFIKEDKYMIDLSGHYVKMYYFNDHFYLDSELSCESESQDNVYCIAGYCYLNGWIK